MKIALACKLDNNGAYGFIKPIADIEVIKQVDVFRDMPAISDNKIKYHIPKLKKPSLLAQLCKLFQMLISVDSSVALSVGIYEIPHGLLAFIVGKIKKVPVVICIIGNPGYRKIRKGFRKWLMYFMLKRTECVTVTGSAAKKIVVENGVDAGKIRILPNSIDTDKFQKKDCEKKYDLITLGRLSSEKELVKFLEITVLLKNKYPDISCAIAGKGPESDRLQQKADQAGLEGNVRFLGYVDNIVDFYNSGKVFVLTSSTEGLPRTLIEAMACGVPCVAPKVGDVEDLVKDEETGFIIDNYSDIDTFVDKIIYLLENQENYNLISQKAMSFSKSRYSFQTATNVWKDILTDIYGDKYDQ